MEGERDVDGVQLPDEEPGGLSLDEDWVEEHGVGGDKVAHEDGGEDACRSDDGFLVLLLLLLLLSLKRRCYR